MPELHEHKWATTFGVLQTVTTICLDFNGEPIFGENLRCQDDLQRIIENAPKLQDLALLCPHLCLDWVEAFEVVHEQKTIVTLEFSNFARILLKSSDTFHHFFPSLDVEQLELVWNNRVIGKEYGELPVWTDDEYAVLADKEHQPWFYLVYEILSTEYFDLADQGIFDTLGYGCPAIHTNVALEQMGDFPTQLAGSLYKRLDTTQL
ncbi:hypothetical protein T439DRAFT_360340 [Meredithblackwellia eburnea MCA 4105]